MINNPAIVSTENNFVHFDNCKHKKISLTASTALDILPKNQKRLYAAFVNNSQTNITLVLGSRSGAVIDEGIILKPSGSYEITQINLYVGTVSAISSAAAILSTLR